MNEVVELVEIVYEVGGFTGLVILALVILMYFAVKTIKGYAEEAKLARRQVCSIQTSMTERLEQMLEECERECKEKDVKIDVKENEIRNLRNEIELLKRNEQNMIIDIENLKVRVRNMERLS